jgi:hypothetical protein
MNASGREREIFSSKWPTRVAAFVFVILAFGAQLTAADQTTDKDWQVKAIAKYPSLGVKGSPFNRQFLEECEKLRLSNPSYFTNPQWPLLLADKLALAQGERPKSEAERIADLLVQIPIWVYVAICIVLAIATMIYLAIRASTLEARKRELLWKQICDESDQFTLAIQNAKALPIVSTHLLLPINEVAFYYGPSVLYETRAVRHYQSGSMGFRVAKGVYIGGSSGRSLSTQELTQIGTGTLTITNKRLIFDGTSADRAIPLAKIIACEVHRDSVEISSSNRQKSMLFEAKNPLILATVIRVCCEGWGVTART